MPSVRLASILTDFVDLDGEFFIELKTSRHQRLLKMFAALPVQLGKPTAQPLEALSGGLGDLI